jgi:hypothetical protein
MRIFLLLISLSFLGFGCGDDDGDKAASENNTTANNEMTASTQKSRLFAQILAWASSRPSDVCRVPAMRASPPESAP